MALVVFELLARFEDEGALRIDDPAERLALSLLHAALEEQLVEPLKANYGDLLAAARQELRRQGAARLANSTLQRTGARSARPGRCA